MKIGILISGRGSNMVAIVEAVQSGIIPDSEVVVVISDRSSAEGIQKAANRKIETLVVTRRAKTRTREEHDTEIIAELKKCGVELICLAGYMRLLSKEFVRTFPNRIINIHPSLLPSFKGLDAQQQAIDYGVKVSGCTVHFVDEDLDHGAIILQKAVEVKDDDTAETLSERILENEHALYVEAVKKIAEGKVQINGRKVSVFLRAMSLKNTEKSSKGLPAALRGYLGEMKRRLATTSRRTGAQLREYSHESTLTPKQIELLKHVNPEIHHNDEMYSGNGAHYFMAGLSAVACIDAALANTEEIPVKNILDMPCGHGRELRVLAARFPLAKFTAGDIQTEAVDFCAKTFGVKPFYSRPELNELNFSDKFDLIWCGSLITHLNNTAIMELLELFSRSLNPGGVMVFSAHGDFAVADMVKGSAIYMIPAEYIPAMEADYQKWGYAYHDYTHDSNYFEFYPDERGYGISLTSPAWIREQIKNIPELQEVYFQERGWCNHQDAYGFVKLG